MHDLSEKIPPILMGEELEQRLTYLPDYDSNTCKADAGKRLMELNQLSDIYIPSQMTYEIYSKIYLAMLHSLGKKQSIDAVRQGNENHKRVQGTGYNSILGGSDSFSIVGKSGIGKSTAIAKSIEISGGMEIITLQDPCTNVIPFINIQCPHDCSIKGLLLSILGQVDMMIGTNYRDAAIKAKASIDVLIGMVSQVALNHILLIVVDECQNICRNKNGVNLVSALTQLINSSGISICLVGLPETENLFQREMHLARRSIGLSYMESPFDDYFVRFCETIYTYQYVARPSAITPEIIETLYQCSNGVIGLVVSLFLESQQMAILSGREELTKEVILNTFYTRMRNLQDFIDTEPIKAKQTSQIQKVKALPKIKPKTEKAELQEKIITKGKTLKELVQQSKEEDADIIELLKVSDIQITEVAL